MTEKINDTIKRHLEEKDDVFLVDTNFLNQDNALIIEVFVDTDEGITLDHCARLSKELAALLEEKDFIDSAYNIMLSSPGLTRPLSHVRQFKKSIGKDLTLVYFGEDGSEESADLTLLELEPDSLTFSTSKNETVKIEKKNIKSATLKLKW